MAKAPNPAPSRVPLTKISQKTGAGRRLNGKGRPRDRFELWCDRHNHKMALIRTAAGAVILLLQLYLILTRL